MIILLRILYLLTDFMTDLLKCLRKYSYEHNQIKDRNQIYYTKYSWGMYYNNGKFAIIVEL